MSGHTRKCVIVTTKVVSFVLPADVKDWTVAWYEADFQAFLDASRFTAIISDGHNTAMFDC